MLNHFITNGLVVIVVLGIMIFIHELGHFAAAKAFGVRVLIFSLGFGKTLLHFKRGDTDYRISALPFGGYVKMAGDDPSEVREGDKGEFLSQARWKRFVIVVMGPVMNILLAVALLTGLYKWHFERPAYLDQAARIGDVEDGSPAAKINIKPGDQIVRFGNEENPKWQDIDLKVVTSVNEAIPLEILHDGQIVKTSITPVAKGSEHAGFVGWDPVAPGVLEEVMPDLPASKAGLKPGDEITGINGRKVLFFPNIATTIRSGDGKPLVLDVVRAGQSMQVTIQPTYGEVMGEKHWRVGIAFKNGMVVQQLSWGKALSAAVDSNIQGCRLVFDVLGKIATRRMSPKQLSGPIGIAQASGEAYRRGIPDLIGLVSMISLQLGIFNLLPIPVLDGGVILLLLVESLIRRDLSLTVKERFVQVGIVFLLLLVAFVMYNDLVKTIRPS